MTHRKKEDITKTVCKYFWEGKCKFETDVFWYSHSLDTSAEKEKENSKECCECKKIFRNVSEPMTHKKKLHGKSQICKYYVNGSCQFEDKCWYLHIKPLSMSECAYGDACRNKA